MIQLADDCLLFQTSAGEGIPYSAGMISVELLGDSGSVFDPDFIQHAAAAVFHYFREELGRETVSVAEFSLALERVLRGFSLKEPVSEAADGEIPQRAHSDLTRLVGDSDRSGELFFFPRLRDELRAQLQQSPQMLCFQGLRPCVKQLTGARRWCGRCQSLQDQIVDFLRTCITQEAAGANCALVVR